MSGASVRQFDAPNPDGWAAFDPDKLFADLIEAGESWADREAAAQILEETRKPLLHKIGTESDQKAESARERVAYASADYDEHVHKMVDARQQANRAKVKYAAIQVLTELLRTRESTRRAEMGMAR